MMHKIRINNNYLLVPWGRSCEDIFYPHRSIQTYSNNRPKLNIIILPPQHPNPIRNPCAFYWYFVETTNLFLRRLGGA